jgi:hypothetical protein
VQLRELEMVELKLKHLILLCHLLKTDKLHQLLAAWVAADMFDQLFISKFDTTIFLFAWIFYDVIDDEMQQF